MTRIRSWFHQYIVGALFCLGIVTPAHAGVWADCARVLNENWRSIIGTPPEDTPETTDPAVQQRQDKGPYRSGPVREPRVQAHDLSEVYAKVVLAVARERGLSEEAISRVNPESLEFVEVMVNGTRLAVAKTVTTQFVFYAMTGKNPSWFRKREHADGDYTEVDGTPLLLNHPVESLTLEMENEFFAAINEALKSSELSAKPRLRSPFYEEWRHIDVDQHMTKSQILKTQWVRENSGDRTHAVGLKPANELGLRDVSGNVRISLRLYKSTLRERSGGNWWSSAGFANILRYDRPASGKPYFNNWNAGIRAVSIMP